MGTREEEMVVLEREVREHHELLYPEPLIQLSTLRLTRPAQERSEKKDQPLEPLAEGELRELLLALPRADVSSPRSLVPTLISLTRHAQEKTHAVKLMESDGAIPRLVSVLCNAAARDAMVAEKTACIQAGAVAACLALVKIYMDTSPEVVEYALRAVANLSHDHLQRPEFALPAEDIGRILIAMKTHATRPNLVGHGMALLVQCTYVDADATGDIIVAHDGIELLVNALSDTVRPLLVKESRIFPSVVRLLRAPIEAESGGTHRPTGGGPGTTRSRCVQVIGNMSHDDQARKEGGAAGAVQALVELLGTCEGAMISHCMWALHNLLLVNSTNKVAFAESRGISVVLQRIRSSKINMLTEFAGRILIGLASENSVFRTQLLGAGVAAIAGSFVHQLTVDAEYSVWTAVILWLSQESGALRLFVESPNDQNQIAAASILASTTERQTREALAWSAAFLARTKDGGRGSGERLMETGVMTELHTCLQGLSVGDRFTAVKCLEALHSGSRGQEPVQLRLQVDGCTRVAIYVLKSRNSEAALVKGSLLVLDSITDAIPNLAPAAMDGVVVSVLEALMQWHRDLERCTLCITILLKYLRLLPCPFLLPEFVAAITSVMKAHPDDLDLSRSCMSLLCALPDDQQGRKLVVEGGAMPVLVGCVQHYPSDVQIAEMGTKLLARCADTDDYRPALSRSGAPDMISKGLPSWRNDSPLSIHNSGMIVGGLGRWEPARRQLATNTLTQLSGASTNSDPAVRLAVGYGLASLAFEGPDTRAVIRRQGLHAIRESGTSPLNGGQVAWAIEALKLFALDERAVASVQAEPECVDVHAQTERSVVEAGVSPAGAWSRERAVLAKPEGTDVGVGVDTAFEGTDVEIQSGGRDIEFTVIEEAEARALLMWEAAADWLTLLQGLTVDIAASRFEGGRNFAEQQKMLTRRAAELEEKTADQEKAMAEREKELEQLLREKEEEAERARKEKEEEHERALREKEEEQRRALDELERDRDSALREREAERERALEMKENEHHKAMREREAEVREKEAEAARKGELVGKREEDADKRAREQGDKDGELREREDKLRDAERDADNRREDVAKREGQASAREEGLRLEEERLAAEREAAARRAEQVAAREAEAKEKEGKLSDEAIALAQKLNPAPFSHLSNTTRREADLGAQSQALQKLQTGLDEREEGLGQRERDIDDKESSLSGREIDVRREGARLEALSASLEATQEKLGREEEDVRQAAAAAAARERELAGRAAQLEEEMARVGAREGAVEEAERRLAETGRRWEDLEGAERANRLREDRLTRGEAEVGAREEAAAERAAALSAREREASRRYTDAERMRSEAMAEASKHTSRLEEIRRRKREVTALLGNAREQQDRLEAAEIRDLERRARPRGPPPRVTDMPRLRDRDAKAKLLPPDPYSVPQYTVFPQIKVR